MRGVRRGTEALRERDGELRLLRSALSRAAAGRGTVVIARGPAGIGKSRLLDAAAGLARPALGTLGARGSELERALPFGAVLQLLERRVRESPELLNGPARAVRPLFLEAGVAGAEESDDELPVLLHGLYRMVAELAERKPLTLLVDDAHLLDGPSLRFLIYLAQRIRGLPVALIATLRPSDPACDARLVAELVQTPGAARIEPRPLSDEAVAAMVEDRLGRSPHPALARACVTATGGNPLLVGELARTLFEQGATGAASDVGLVQAAGPEPVAWTVQRTLGTLPGPAWEIARALSVLGAHATEELAAALAGVDIGLARESVATMEAAGLAEADARVRFAHALIGQAVRATVPPPELALLHSKAAELLANGSDESAAAAHLLLSPPAARAWAVATLVAAAAAARRRAAPERAVALLERAVSEPPSADQRPRVLADLAAAQAAAGDSKAAVETFAAAIDCAEGDAERARLLLGLALAYHDQARFADAVDAATRGLALEPRDGQLRAKLASLHDTARLWSTHEPAAADSAAAADAPLAESRRLLLAGRNRAAALETARRVWAGGAVLTNLAPGDPTASRLFVVLHNADAFDEALEVADRCLADALGSGSPMDIATWRHMRGHALAYAGRLEEAEPELRAAFAAREQGWASMLPLTAGALAHVLIERDDLDGAGAVISAARACGGHPAESPMWAFADAARGRLALERGDPSEAFAILDAALRRGHEEIGLKNPAAWTCRSDTVLALAALGRTEQALTRADEDLELAEAWGAPRALGRALVVRGTVGAPDERLDLLTRAVDLLEPSVARLEHARAAAALGAWLRASGDLLRARDTLRAAVDLAERCGATRVARGAIAELRLAGGRPRRRRLEGPASLTDTEARVAQLAASGLSNRAIGEQLVVTPRTVAFHLGNVYRKLGVSGRRALGAALAESAS